MTSYLRGIVIKLLLMVTATLVAIILGEIVLRQLEPYPGRYLIWPPHLRKVFNPSPDIISGMAGPIHYKISADGIRGEELSDDQKYRVLTLGGSTTECFYQDQKRTWPALIERHLHRVRPDARAWVGNLGKSGFNSRHHAVQMKYQLPQLPRMDTIIVLVGCNDLALRLIRGDAYDPNHLCTAYGEQHQIRRTFLYYPLGMGFLWDLKDTAWSRLIRSVRAKKTSPLALDEDAAMVKGMRERRSKAKRIFDQLPEMKSAMVEYARNIDTLIDFAMKRSVRIVFLTQPSVWRTDLSEAERALLWSGVAGDLDTPAGQNYYSVEALNTAMALYNKTLQEVCAQRKIECIDLAAKIPKDTEHFFDDVHFTDLGSQLVADEVVAYFEGAHKRDTAFGSNNSDTVGHRGWAIGR